MTVSRTTSKKKSVARSTKSSPRNVDITAKDDDDRTVYLVGDVDESLIKDVIERIVTLSEKGPMKPIYLIINTFGGEVDDAFALFDVMKFVAAPIRTVALGKVMSAGCLILAAGEKGRRKMGANARLMYHAGWEIATGNVWEMRISLREFERMEDQYDKLFADETKMTLDQVKLLYADRQIIDRYILPEECLKLGIIDEII